MRHQVRRNSDASRRELERLAAQGDPEAALALDMDLKRSGDWSEHYARLLIDGLVEDAETRTSPGGPWSRPDAEEVFQGREGGPVVLGPGNLEQVFAPDTFGRPQGLFMTLEVTRDRLGYSYAGGMSREFEQSLQVNLTVTLIPPSPRGGVVLNPIYWFFRNDRRWRLTVEDRFKRVLPSRSHSEHLTLNDLQSWSRIDDNRPPGIRGPLDRPGAVEAVIWAIDHAMEDLNLRLRWAQEALDRVEGALGPSPSGPQVMNSVASRAIHGTGRDGLQRIVDELQTAPGPEVGLGSPGRVHPTAQAWNVSGGGILAAALAGLGEWLQRNHKAVISEIRADAYEQEVGYFARGYMRVTSTRARRTNNPLEISVDFDAVNGAWAGRDWIGNRIPRGGIWRINMTNTPATAAEFADPAIQWIKQVFPDSVIEVAAWWESGTTRPDYRQEYPK